jgi:succinate dehydrogenase/fumarate reductase iron-sulfur protein
MKEDLVKVRIERYDPAEERRYLQSYSVPRGSRLRVLDFLNYIFEELDQSLSYRRHLCKAKMCNGCLMMINGKPGLACWELIPASQSEINLSPLKGKKVLKDLIVDLSSADSEYEQI